MLILRLRRSFHKKPFHPFPATHCHSPPIRPTPFRLLLSVTLSLLLHCIGTFVPDSNTHPLLPGLSCIPFKSLPIPTI
ncbi:hypothetical protein VN97_g10051 [Penicillium thymicola]|uniref:Uncharacterized protein n=1 Tax=Penicillium thymicola TaxID=293382 RepID=A0AAI9X4N7_PENTH|nr:hypothetical protein VN97_g10051 [Penicillium thymicola]